MLVHIKRIPTDRRSSAAISSVVRVSELAENLKKRQHRYSQDSFPRAQRNIFLNFFEWTFIPNLSKKNSASGFPKKFYVSGIAFWGKTECFIKVDFFRTLSDKIPTVLTKLHSACPEKVFLFETIYKHLTSGKKFSAGL